MLDKYEVKGSMTLEDVEQVIEYLGGQFRRDGIDKLIVETICHNYAGEGSHKLFYYHNTRLFNCYTGCGVFDIYDLVTFVKGIDGEDYTLNDSIEWVANMRGFSSFNEDGEQMDFFIEGDIGELEPEYKRLEPREFDRTVFDKTTRPAVVSEWVGEGIPAEVQRDFEVNYSPSLGSVVFPHYSPTGESVVGLRQRAMSKDVEEAFGKYRPVTAFGTTYSSPLSSYLYALDRNREKIKELKRALIMEGEKSTMKMEAAVGKGQNISLASFGMNFSIHHYHLLKDLGVEEIVIGFDKQFQERSKRDREFVQFINKLTSISNRFHMREGDNIKITFMFDLDDDLNYKDAPIDRGIEIFSKLYRERRTLEDLINELRNNW